MKSVPLRFLLFAALLASAAPAAETPYEWRGVDRIVAVGDVHGDCGQLIQCLRSAGVLDAAGKWSGGKTHLVQTGDIMGRGPESKQAMDLLMALEPQAIQAGGRVHALLGNHEAFVLGGYYGYLHPAETASHGGLQEFRKAMGTDGKYGKWIRSHPAVIKINDVLFVHGGLAPRHAAVSIEEINRAARKALDTPEPSDTDGDEENPLWYRRLAIDDEAIVRDRVKPVLERHGARHIVIGHTMPAGAHGIQARAGGAVMAIDVGMSRHYRGGSAACLLIEAGKFYSVSAEGTKGLAPEP